MGSAAILAPTAGAAPTDPMQPVTDLSTQCNQVSPSLLTDALTSA